MSVSRFDASPALALMLTAFVFSSCGDGASAEDPTLEPPLVSERRLTVEGDRMIDSVGREVLLRGFNVGNRAKMPPFLPFELSDGETVEAKADALFSKIEALGANVVRLTFSWEAFEPTEGTYDMEYLGRYRALLDAAGAHGLGAIVDFHQDVFASPFCGDGFPLWAIGDSIPYGEPHYDCGFPNWALPALDPNSDVSAAYDRLWENTDGLQDAMEAMWRTVAKELSNHSAVVGFEVINEPGAGSVSIDTFEREVLPSFIARMGAAIRAEAGDFPIFNGGRAGDAIGTTNELRQPELSSFVFAPHFYDPLISIGLFNFNADAVGMRVDNMLAPAT
ncbi:MAG: cellulase family glycosylhydrolase, partial [Polyangiaceae bacterium]|nr:cellulase family glycosylhydrolase [Polyangiaceae bacterium]